MTTHQALQQALKALGAATVAYAVGSPDDAKQRALFDAMTAAQNEVWAAAKDVANYGPRQQL